MRVHELKNLESMHEQYLTRGVAEKPNLNRFLVQALRDRKPVKMRDSKSITKMAQESACSCRYGDADIKLHFVFSSCADYEKAVAAFEKYESARKKRVAAYRKIADPLIRKARVSHEAKSDVIAETITHAAAENGLHDESIEAPTFEPVAFKDDDDD